MLIETDQEAIEWIMSIERVDPERSMAFDVTDIVNQIKIYITVPTRVHGKSYTGLVRVEACIPGVGRINRQGHSLAETVNQIAEVVAQSRKFWEVTLPLE